MMDAYDSEPDVVFGVGTTASFSYMLEPFERAAETGKTTVIVDPQPTKVLAKLCKFVVKKPAEQFLPYLFDRVTGDMLVGTRPCIRS
jgi:hypothetical protein